MASSVSSHGQKVAAVKGWGGDGIGVGLELTWGWGWGWVKRNAKRHPHANLG